MKKYALDFHDQACDLQLAEDKTENKKKTKCIFRYHGDLMVVALEQCSNALATAQNTLAFW